MGLTKPRAHQLQDIDYKQTTRALTDTNITLSGGAPATVDGVSLALHDRVLVTGQSTASENGIYYVTTVGAGSNGTWARSLDANETGELNGGTIIMVTEGTNHGDTQWKLTTDDPITIGTTALNFALNSSAAYGVVAVAGQSSIVANSVGDTLTVASGNNNIVVTTNAGTETLTIAVNDTPSFDSATVTGNVTAGNISTAGTLTYSTLNDGTTTLTSTVAELNYVDGVTSAIQTQLDAKLALAGGTMSGAIAMGTSKITGMGDPTSAQDAATKAYVDSEIADSSGDSVFSQNSDLGDVTDSVLISQDLGLVTGDVTETHDLGTISVQGIVFTTSIADDAVTSVKLSGLTNSSSGVVAADGDGTFSAGGTVTAIGVQETVYNLGTTGGTITPNFTNGAIQKITLNNNLTFSAFTSPVAGQSITLIIDTNGTGRTLTSTMLFAGGNKTMSTTDTTDVMTVLYDGTNYLANYVTDFS